MIGKAFFLFPGQGAQTPGMAMDLYEKSGERVKQLFALCSGIYGKDMADVLANSSPDTLKRTDVCQPAITLANLVAAAHLASMGIASCGCAGFSLGEFAALAIAGIISEEDCFRLVIARGKAMQDAIDKISGDTAGMVPGMGAIMGLEPQKVESLIDDWKSSGAITDLYAANINSPKQTVVSGSAEALAEGEKLFIAAGAKRFIRLQVAGPYHSPFMESAAGQFRPVLEKIAFNDPKIPFYSNVSGKRVLSGEEAKKLSLAQITGAVRWTDEEAAIAADSAGSVFGGTGIEALLECGPGKVLQGLWKDTGSAIPCLPAGTYDDIEKLKENV